jgi:hypothetical protein
VGFPDAWGPSARAVLALKRTIRSGALRGERDGGAGGSRTVAEYTWIAPLTILAVTP